MWPAQSAASTAYMFYFVFPVCADWAGLYMYEVLFPVQQKSLANSKGAQLLCQPIMY